MAGLVLQSTAAGRGILFCFWPSSLLLLLWSTGVACACAWLAVLVWLCASVHVHWLLSVWLCVCVSLYVFACSSECLCMHLWVPSLYVFVYAFNCVFLYVCLCLCVCLCICWCICLIDCMTMFMVFRFVGLWWFLGLYVSVSLFVSGCLCVCMCVCNFAHAFVYVCNCVMAGMRFFCLSASVWMDVWN